MLSRTVTLVVCMALVAAAAFCPAQEADKHFKYLGASTCKGCHTTPFFMADFVSLNEAARWKNRDKHSMAVRLLFGMVRTGEKGRITIDPGKRENSLGLAMLARLKVLSDDDLTATLARGEEMNAKLQAAQDKVEAAQEKYFKARLAALTGADNADEVEALDKEMRDADEEVKAVERDYMQPILDLCVKSPVGRGCLACHADLPKDGFSANIDAASFEQESLRDGVSCEACHGPGSEYLDPHYKAEWRTQTQEHKIALGLNDLRHPAVRANQCYSCHIGDIKQGKFIDHAWYMAGHPPLPSIEVETFAHDMPRHWRYLSEKKNFRNRDEFVKVNSASEKHGFEINTKYPQTKEVLVGGVVALRKSAALLAEVHEDPRYGKSIIPDFAAFDCQACHQDLRTRPVVTRDEHKFDPFVPGRPNIPRWTFALADVAVGLSDDEEDRKKFDAAIHDWREALTGQPFGDRKLVGPAAANLTSLLASLENRLARQETTAEMAKQASDALRTTAREELLDFHSARQVMWALQVVASEAGEPVPAELKYPAEENDTNVSRYLQLKLPAGATTLITDDKNLPQLLLRIDAYDPEKFQALVREALK